MSSLSSINTPTTSGFSFDTSYTNVPPLFYSRQRATAVVAPSMVIFNTSLANDLGLTPSWFHTPEGVETVAGIRVPDGATPLAQAYAGHQFGHLAMLGDGRALLLGEHLDPQGNRWDIQLKGSGRTPYSRGGDGRATLSAMLREYVISEAMAGLGIPTTRSLAVVATGEKVYRDTPQPGAILTRVASSHIRVGTFVYAASQKSTEPLKDLADYTIARHYPELVNHPTPYRAFIHAVMQRQAHLLAQWWQVGFIHGVMNSDNMTISGETIDFGPCAFMNSYDSATVFSSIDTRGRYAFGNQPAMAHWNLARFNETLLALLHKDEDAALAIANEEIGQFLTLFDEAFQKILRGKLGLVTEETDDPLLWQELCDLMQANALDYTDTFRQLTLGENLDLTLASWIEKWQTRLGRQEATKEQVRAVMQAHNPAIIARNHWVEEALTSAVQGDLSPVKRLVELLRNPFAYSEEQLKEAALPIPDMPHYQTYCGT